MPDLKKMDICPIMLPIGTTAIELVRVPGSLTDGDGLRKEVVACYEQDGEPMRTVLHGIEPPLPRNLASDVNTLRVWAAGIYLLFGETVGETRPHLRLELHLPITDEKWLPHNLTKKSSAYAVYRLLVGPSQSNPLRYEVYVNDGVEGLTRAMKGLSYSPRSHGHLVLDPDGETRGQVMVAHIITQWLMMQGWGVINIAPLTYGRRPLFDVYVRTPWSFDLLRSFDIADEAKPVNRYGIPGGVQ